MATIRRILRKIPMMTWHNISSPKALNPSRSLHSPLPLPLYNYRNIEKVVNVNNFGGSWRGGTMNGNSRLMCVLPAALAGLTGFSLLEVAYADAADEGAVKLPFPSESPSSYADLEETARKERQRLEELLKRKGMQYGSYPRFIVAVKGQKVTIKFQVPPTCEVPRLIAILASSLGLKVEEHGGGSDMRLRAWDSAVAWQLTLDRPQQQKQAGGEMENAKDTRALEGDLCVLLFHSLISSDRTVILHFSNLLTQNCVNSIFLISKGFMISTGCPNNIVLPLFQEIEFIKQGSFSSQELDALVSVLEFAGSRSGQNKTLERRPREDNARMPSADKSVQGLESLGVKVYGLDEPIVGNKNNEISWENIAGYDQQKREIEDTILLALRSPEVYDHIAHVTRRKFESNRPRAVLFEGPPGTGKTSSARVIANQAGVPLLYVPLEVVMSKFYGESERLLGKVFTLANELPNGAIVFLDEVDSFAIARDSEMHEATRRILSVLLRQIDGFEQEKKVVVIAATNRKQDLDPALISRFDSMITFGLPDHHNREEIAAQYAKHLLKSELAEFASVMEEMSGRDIRDVCLQAERHWASKIIRRQVATDSEQVYSPPLQEYIDSALDRKKALLSITDQKTKHVQNRSKKPQLDMS